MAFAPTYFKQYNKYKNEKNQTNKNKESSLKIDDDPFCQEQFH